METQVNEEKINNENKTEIEKVNQKENNQTETKETKKWAVYEFVENFLKTHKTIAEIIRFLIVGGIATLVDMFSMGVFMYFTNISKYKTFLNVFYGGGSPSGWSVVVGTGVGFVIGLIINYILSIAFVFENKNNAKSKTGFVIFTVLSVIGLGINMLGTFIGYDLLHFNEWIVKIVIVIIVLIYNYISKKLVLFRSKQKKEI